jgi:hypothetical protein
MPLPQKKEAEPMNIQNRVISRFAASDWGSTSDIPVVLMVSEHSTRIAVYKDNGNVM